MISKQATNQMVFLASNCLLLVLYSSIFILQPSFWLILILLPFLAFFLHYQYNTIHLASHAQLSKNRQLNSLIGNIASIWGGTTLAAFRTNHLEHHKKPTDPQVDPDDKIVSGTPLILIPFKIWYHDFNFFKSGFFRRKNHLPSYLLVRLIQLMTLGTLVFSGNLNWFLVFWVFPVLVLGVLNALFLFYFPHYTTPRIDKYEQLSHPNIFQKLVLGLIFISRYYHLLHHKNPSKNRNYYPVYSFFRDSLQHKKNLKIKISALNV